MIRFISPSEQSVRKQDSGCLNLWKPTPLLQAEYIFTEEIFSENKKKLNEDFSFHQRFEPHYTEKIASKELMGQ